MSLDVLERKQKEHHIGEVIKEWRLLEISCITHKAIIQCEKCGLIKKADISNYFNAKIAPCLCSGVTTWNNEPIICNTDIQKQVLDMLKAEKSYSEIGNTMDMTRQAVGSIVKTMRNNYLKYLKQLEKSNEIKANRE